MAEFPVTKGAMKFLIKLLINTLAILAISKIVPGISIQDFSVAVVSALVLAVLNAVLRPFIIMITLPVNILTLGLLTLVINGFMLVLTSKLINGFSITGFWPAFVGGVCISVISLILNMLIGINKLSISGRQSAPRRNVPNGHVIDAEIVENKKKMLDK